MNSTVWLVGMVVLTGAYAIALLLSIRREYHAGSARGKVALGYTGLGLLLGVFIHRILTAV